MAIGVHLFSFLGTGLYSEVIYEVLGEQAWQSPEVKFVQTASALRLGDSLKKVTIFATEAASEKHGPSLLVEFEREVPHIRPELVKIPTGLSRDEALKLFEVLSGVLKTGPKSLVFDLTHGFRTQPALALMALNYLTSLDADLQVQDILYGAFDKPSFENGQRVFELVSLGDFWKINDWAAGFDLFRQTGSTRGLAKLSDEVQGDFFKQGKKEKSMPNPELTPLARALHGWQQAVEANAVPHLFGPGKDIKTRAAYQALTLEWNATSKEIGRFVEPLREEMSAALEPMLTDDAWWSLDGLRAQLVWMKWLTKHGHYQSVFTVGKEWFITLIQQVMGWLEDRERANALFGQCVAAQEHPEKASLEALRIAVFFDATRGNGKTFFGIASGLANRRNQLNHAHMPMTNVKTSERQGVPNLETACQEFCETFERLLEVTKSWDGTPLASDSAIQRMLQQLGLKSTAEEENV